MAIKSIILKVNELDNWIQEYFGGQDLITIDDLISIIEEQKYDIERLEEEIKNIEEDTRENYRRITPYEQYGVSEKDFY